MTRYFFSILIFTIVGASEAAGSHLFCHQIFASAKTEGSVAQPVVNINPKVRRLPSDPWQSLIGKIVDIQLTTAEAEYYRRQYQISDEISLRNVMTGKLVAVTSGPRTLLVQLSGGTYHIPLYYNRLVGATKRNYIRRSVTVAADQTQPAPVSEATGNRFKDMVAAMIAETEAVKEEYADVRAVQRLDRILRFYKRLSGNIDQSMLHQRREIDSERFYRMLRSGKRIDALRIIRGVVAPIISSAYIVRWAQQTIESYQREAQSQILSPELKGQIETHIAELEKIIAKEAWTLGDVGRGKLLAFQMTRFLANAKEFLETLAPRAAIDKEMATIFDELHKDVVDQVEYIASRASGLENFGHIFPRIYGPSERPRTANAETLMDLIYAELRFAEEVFRGQAGSEKFGEPVYGGHLPLLAFLKREIHWERLAALDNIVGFVTHGFDRFFLTINRETLEAKVPTSSPFWSWASAWNGLAMVKRNTIYLLFQQLARVRGEIETFNQHAPRIGLLEQLNHRRSSGLLSRTDYITSVLQMKDAFPSNDFFMSFARIPEYRLLFRETLQTFELEIAAIKATYGRDGAAGKEEKALAQMRAAELVANAQGNYDLPLVKDPDVLRYYTDRALFYGGGAVATVVGSRLALQAILSPEQWEALNSWLPQFFN